MNDDAPPPPRRRIGLWVGVGVPVVLMAAMVISLLPRTDESSPPKAPSPVLEALCVDDKDRPLASLRTDGDCPAPSTVKLFFIRPPHAPRVSVAAFSQDTTRFITTVERPRRRRMVPQTIQLQPGDSVTVVLDPKNRLDENILRQQPPLLRIQGTRPDPTPASP